MKDEHDQSIPSSIAIMVLNNLRFYSLTEDENLLNKAELILRAYASRIRTNAYGYASYLIGLDFYLQKLNRHRRIIKDNQYCGVFYGEDGGADSVIGYNKAEQRYYATMINNKWGYKAMEWKKTSFKFNTKVKGI